MDLTHQSITGRQFELNRRGYDPDAVNAHLSEIASVVGERERHIAELESTIESLQAKVQDANESEEALRLTLKAAAHAKEELLAGARNQAARMEQEAAAKVEALVSEATARANELTNSAEARAALIDQKARSHAGQVAQAALAESKLLIERIQGMRQTVASAEGALAAIQVETGPRIQAAREALDGAMARATEIAEDPSVLEMAAEEHIAAEAPSPIEPAPEDGMPKAQVEPGLAEPQVPPPGEGGSDEHPGVAEQQQVVEQADAGSAALAHGPDRSYAEASQPPPSGPQAEEALRAEASPSEAGPHLEVVATEKGAEEQESAAQISDKVDRLLEELREVT